jgi:tRNA(Ile)-lysidine synthase
MANLYQNRLIVKVEKRLKESLKGISSPKKKVKILVGFSGGKDSTFLLYALFLLKERLNLSLFAAHINHQIRGEEAERDEKFCREFCGKLKIPLFVKRFDVKRYARRKRISLEEAGRVIRYRFLEEMRNKKGLDFIALGHNATDNCETMLLSLIKGKGLSGIAGIPEKRERIIRPLIDLKSEEIDDFLKKNNIPYVFDTTNLSLSHPRNYLRHLVLPFLREINPNLEETMRHTARILQEEDAYLKEVGAKLKENGVRKISGGYLIDKKIFLSYNFSVRRRVLKELFDDMSYSDIERVVGLGERPVGKMVSLRNGLWAINEPEGIFIGRLEERISPDSEKVLRIGGINRIEESGLELLVRLKKRGRSLDLGGDKEYFDRDAIFPPLAIRYWRPGDFLFSEKGRKKLQDLFVDHKIPRRLRSQIPILVDREGILWVLGVRRANRAKISEKTKRILEVRIERWKENPIKKV